MCKLLSLLVISLQFEACYSFTQKPFLISTIRKGSSLKYSNHMDDAVARLNARTCIRNFLTQRSIQSFMFLQEQCRDPHTVDWIEKFTNTSNMLDFHGTGALNLDKYGKWDTFFLDMMGSDIDQLIVTVKKRGRGIGGSKNNPYMKDQDRTIQFTVNIDPPSLASRILAVREQIGKEFGRDLDIIAMNGGTIIQSYFENRAKERESEAYKDGERPEMPDEDNIVSSSDEASRPKFNRDTMRMLLNFSSNQGYAPSPLRIGNFDLLLLLATQASIHRLLRKLQISGPESEATFQWLRTFYVDRASKFFDGSGKYGRHDDFVEELLSSSPTLQKKGKKVSIVDPIGIAEQIILIRSDVANEWKNEMDNVNNDHMNLKRTLLTRQIEEVGLMDDAVNLTEGTEVTLTLDIPFSEFE